MKKKKLVNIITVVTFLEVAAVLSVMAFVFHADILVPAVILRIRFYRELGVIGPGPYIITILIIIE